MLKTRALNAYLQQAIGTGSGITGIVLLDEDGRQMASATDATSSKNAYSSLMAAIWETFERQGIQDRLQEMNIEFDLGIVLVRRVATMLLVVFSDGTLSVAVLRAKLRGLAVNLEEPLMSIVS